jgi:foldase protein PrsA
MRRIVIIAAAVFLAGIVGWVGYGFYKDRIKPLGEVIIKVNDTSFTTDYYVKMLEAYITGMEPSQVYYVADVAASQIIRDELIRQGADSLGITVEAQEIDEKIEENKLPDEEIYRDTIAAALLSEELLENYFGSQLPDTMEQAHISAMLVESEEVADEVRPKIEGGENFTAVMQEFSCSPQTDGDLGWLPKELMPSFIGEAPFDLEPGGVSQPIYDEGAPKSVGYWLIQVTDRDEEKGIQAKAMLLGSEQEASEVKAKLDSGEGFADLAKEYSQHSSKDDDGDLGWVKQGDISEAFDEVAFNLTSDEVSEPVKDTSVQTTGGYWIVKVWDKGEHELSEEVKQSLKDEHFNDWLTEREENSTITVDEERISWAIERVAKG